MLWNLLWKMGCGFVWLLPAYALTFTPSDEGKILLSMDGFWIAVGIAVLVFTYLDDKAHTGGFFGWLVFWAVLLPLWCLAMMYVQDSVEDGRITDNQYVIVMLSLLAGLYVLELIGSAIFFMQYRRKRLREIAQSDDINGLKTDFLSSPLTADYLQLAAHKRIAFLEQNQAKLPVIMTMFAVHSQKNVPAIEGVSSVNQALEVLELNNPFTQSELKKRRAELLQKIHPDHGGSAWMTRMVNEAYELLKAKK